MCGPNYCWSPLTSSAIIFFFYSMKIIVGLVTNILQKNILFCVQQKNEMHMVLEQLEVSKCVNE